LGWPAGLRGGFLVAEIFISPKSRANPAEFTFYCDFKHILCENRTGGKHGDACRAALQQPRRRSRNQDDLSEISPQCLHGRECGEGCGLRAQYPGAQSHRGEARTQSVFHFLPVETALRPCQQEHRAGGFRKIP
jgi:hypothetical protein